MSETPSARPTPNAPLLHYDGLTDLGNRRHNNEDAWWVGQLGGDFRFMEPGEPPPRADLARGPVLLMVSDGVGGANAGEVASQMTVSQISASLGAEAPQLRDRASIIAAIQASVRNANDAVTNKANEPGFDGMGATLSLLCLAADHHAYWGQAGDSRLYLCRRGSLRQISHDHSPVGRLRQSGKLTEAEARVHPLRNQIDQSLGDPNAEFSPDFGVEPFQQGDVFLLCSDGLSDGLWDHEIETVLAKLRAPEDLRPAVQELVNRAKAASGRDNITAVLAWIASGLPAVASGKAGRAWWRQWLRV